jgi:hypothetical protein
MRPWFNASTELAKQVCGDDGAISRMEGGPVAAVAVHQDQMSKLNIEGATATQAVEALKAEENRQRSQVKAFEDAITSAESEKVELEAKREADIPRVKYVPQPPYPPLALFPLCQAMCVCVCAW